MLHSKVIPKAWKQELPETFGRDDRRPYDPDGPTEVIALPPQLSASRNATTPADVEEDIVPDVPRADEGATPTRILPIPIEVKRAAVATEAAPPRRSIVERVKESAALQLMLLCFAGGAAILFLFRSEDEAQNTPESSPIPTFPKVEIEGAPPVTEEEITRQLRMAPLVEPSLDGERSEELIAKTDPDEVKREKLKALAARGREVAFEEVRRKNGSSQASVDADEHTRDGLKEPPREPTSMRGWFIPGGTIKIEGQDADEEKAPRLALAIGDRMFAKLDVGISSSQTAPVLARLTKDVHAGGRLVAPKGAMLKGRFRTDAIRIFVTFEELITASGERLGFDGYATDQKVPGLIAVRREIEGSDPGAGVLRESMDVAKDVVRSVASGSIIGRVAQGVTEGALPETEGAVEGGGFILEVAAGKRFEIVVTGGEP